LINAGKPDKWLLLLVIVLVVFGALMIYSSTSVLTGVMLKKNVTSPLYYFKRHLFTICLGLIAMAVVYRIRPDLLGKISPVLLVISLGLLLLVFTKLGIAAGGAKRWIRLWPSTFQPSEFVKLAMVIFLAWYLSRKFYDPESFWLTMLPIGVMGVFQIIFLTQPDFGAVITLGIITLGMMFLSGMRLKYLLSLCLLAVPVVIKLAMEPYRLKRIASFIDPWSDPRGSGFQLIQSYLALGRGGFDGVGLGKSMQKLAFLPEMHTDFIFSIIGEELGFLAASGLVMAFLLLFLRGIQIAGKFQEEDRFHYYLAYGCSLMLALQALVNFGVVTGLLPTKGLPLPFISYGGSSLLVTLMLMGILFRLSKGEAPRRTEDPFGEAISRRKARRAVYGAV
jgi:cell division protein FtsW